HALANAVGVLFDGLGNTINPALLGTNDLEGNGAAVGLSATAQFNSVTGLDLGTDMAGKKALKIPNDVGLLILGAHNTVGGPQIFDVISGNAKAGVELRGPAATGNTIQ